MMKSTGRLVAATKPMTVGNHRVVCGFPYIQGAVASILHLMQGTTRYFKYHDTIICMVDDVQRRVILSHGGYRTCSTSRAINDYRRFFMEAGYQIVEED